MVQKASRLPTKSDYIHAHDLKIKELFGTMRKRVTIQQSGLFGTVPLGNALPSSASEQGGTGNFLSIKGDTMIGPIAYFPVDVAKDTTFNFINIRPTEANPPDYSSYVLVTGTGVLQFIDGAQFAGQRLILQGTNQQIITIKNMSGIFTIDTIVGDGATQIVTAKTDDPHGFSVGEVVQVDSTVNFNARALVISVPDTTTFTYDLGFVGSATPETAGTAKNGTIITSDGTDITLDGTINALNAPSITLIFDITVPGNGAWRVVSGGAGGGGGGANEFSDAVFRIFDDFDPTSKLSFEIAGVPTATTVTWFVQGASGIVCLLDSGFTQLFEDNIKFTGASTGLELNGRVLFMDVAGDSFLGTIAGPNIFTINLAGGLNFLIQTTGPPIVDVFLKRIQNVNDPVQDLDAVNLRTLNLRLGEAVGEDADIVIRETIGEFASISLTPDFTVSESAISESATIVVT